MTGWMIWCSRANPGHTKCGATDCGRHHGIASLIDPGQPCRSASQANRRTALSHCGRGSIRRATGAMDGRSAIQTDHWAMAGLRAGQRCGDPPDNGACAAWSSCSRRSCSGTAPDCPPWSVSMPGSREGQGEAALSASYRCGRDIALRGLVRWEEFECLAELCFLHWLAP